MSAIQLKEIILSKIAKINDEALLSEINTILDQKGQHIIMMSEEQIDSINKSRQEYSEGNYYSNNLVNEEMEKWLKE